MKSVNIGQAVIIRAFEDRLDKMAEEYEDLLKDANRRIEQLEARSGIYIRMIEDIKELIG